MYYSLPLQEPKRSDREHDFAISVLFIKNAKNKYQMTTVTQEREAGHP